MLIDSIEGHQGTAYTQIYVLVMLLVVIATKIRTVSSTINLPISVNLNKLSGILASQIALQLEALVGDLEDDAAWERGLRQDKLQLCIRIMTNIQQILQTVARSKSQWCHLLRSADKRVDKTFLALKPQVLADQRVLLASVRWPPTFVMSEMGCGKSSSLPNPLALMKGETRQIYSQSFLALCALQRLQAQKENGQLHHFKTEDYTIGLWAIDELVTPVASKMEYRFSKWIDQPELIFSLVHKITRNLSVAVDDVLQPLIDEGRLMSCSAKDAGDKQKRLEVVSSWLHLIDLAITLDNQMQSLVDLESHLLSCNMTEELFKALSALSIFCDRSEWLKIRAKIELKDAWKRLKPDLKDERAWCQTLPSTLARAEFIWSTAVKFLWYFFRALLWRCRKTELYNSYLEDDALTRVCQCLNAANYCESKLREWSDDVNSVELRIVEDAQNMHVDAEGNDKICFFAEELRSLEEKPWMVEGTGLTFSGQISIQKIFWIYGGVSPMDLTTSSFAAF
ncbi:hypothetical protein RJ641_007224 [Dillenia turbinata]|uniref:Uncharacterized protein n=1 Tax=Dillenia turbinata TaxID=194707 RepID=A0AAN8V113_9MAGN